MPMTLSPSPAQCPVGREPRIIYAPYERGRRRADGLAPFIDGLLKVDTAAKSEPNRGRSPERPAAGDEDLLRGWRDAVGDVALRRSGDGRETSRIEQVEFVNTRAGARACRFGQRGTAMFENPQRAAEGLTLPRCARRRTTNARIGGLTLAEARTRIEKEIEERRVQLDELTASIVTEGLATWSGDGEDRRSLIVCGRAHLLEDVRAMEDLERVRLLFEDLDTKTDLIHLLGLAERAEGVRIFYRLRDKLFSLSARR